MIADGRLIDIYHNRIVDSAGDWLTSVGIPAKSGISAPMSSQLAGSGRRNGNTDGNSGF